MQERWKPVRVQVEVRDVQAEQDKRGWVGGVETWSQKVVTGHVCRGRALVTSLDGREAGAREGDPGKRDHGRCYKAEDSNP